MRNVDVIRKFIDGDVKGKTKNLRIEDNKLINYSTVIAERNFEKDVRDNDLIVFNVNTTRYSSSTKAIQNKLIGMLHEQDCYFETCEDVPRGASRLV